MAIKLRGPQNYSSNGRVKTLYMFSFYKNTLTFNCYFSNLSLLCLSFPFHLLMLFSTEGPLGFHLGLTFNLVKNTPDLLNASHYDAFL